LACAWQPGSMLKDGVCNSMPGWDPMTHAFNPIPCEQPPPPTFLPVSYF